jgi:hypothetical protein
VTSKRRISFDKKVDVLTVQPNHACFLVGDLESEMIHVEKRCFLWIVCLNDTRTAAWSVNPLASRSRPLATQGIAAD